LVQKTEWKQNTFSSDVVGKQQNNYIITENNTLILCYQFRATERMEMQSKK